MPKFYTLRQTAEQLSLSYSTAFRKTKTGGIPTIRLSKKILIPAEFIDSLVKSAMSGAKSQGVA